MKLIVYTWPDQGAANEGVLTSIGNPWLKDRSLNKIVPGHALVWMMGAGRNKSQRWVEKEIAKYMKSPGMTRAHAEEYINGCNNGGMTEEAAFDLIARNGCISRPGCTYVFVDKQPGEVWDRVFRAAWEMQGGVFGTNMPMARGIHMNNIRKVRNAELAAKDIAFMRAVEVGDTSTQATIATEKQALRDIPQTFDLTTDTPEQLKAKWPVQLPARE